MNKTCSAADLATLIEARVEASEPQTMIVNYLRTREGKPLTIRDEKALRELTGDVELYIRKQYGMTHIEWGGYGRAKGYKGGSLLIAHSTTGVTVKMENVERHNIAYFGAAVDRNAKRKKALDDTPTLERVVFLSKQLLEAKAELEKLMEYGTPLEPDRYAVREALGLDEKSR